MVCGGADFVGRRKWTRQRPSSGWLGRPSTRRPSRMFLLRLRHTVKNHSFGLLDTAGSTRYNATRAKHTIGKMPNPVRPTTSAPPEVLNSVATPPAAVKAETDASKKAVEKFICTRPLLPPSQSSANPSFLRSRASRRHLRIRRPRPRRPRPQPDYPVPQVVR